MVNRYIKYHSQGFVCLTLFFIFLIRKAFNKKPQVKNSLYLKRSGEKPNLTYLVSKQTGSASLSLSLPLGCTVFLSSVSGAISLHEMAQAKVSHLMPEC